MSLREAALPDAVVSPVAIASAPTAARFDPRTRLLLEAPIGTTLLKLAAPNVLVMFVQASVGLIETYFVGWLGTDALAGVALVFPMVMLMQMMSAGAMGGGISSAVARALGGGRRADANALALHALVIAVIFGLFFMLAVLGGGPWLYGAMGGNGASLAAALTYSNVVFCWRRPLVDLQLARQCDPRHRQHGCPGARYLCPGCRAGAAVAVFDPRLGAFPRLGVAGGAVAVVAYYAIGSAALAAYLRSRRSVLRPAFRKFRFQWRLFRDILRVGGVAALITVQTNLIIVIATALVGRFGPAAIAGYGMGSRLEYLLVPIVFGLGGPLVAMVGTNIGAGRRSARCASRGSALPAAAAITEAIGLTAATFPHAVALAVRHRSGHARRRHALSACGRSILRPVRARHGALFRLAGRWPAALAFRREFDAPRHCRRWRLAGAALDRRYVQRLLRARRGAGRLRANQRRGGCGRGVVLLL